MCAPEESECPLCASPFPTSEIIQDICQSLKRTMADVDETSDAAALAAADAAVAAAVDPTLMMDPADENFPDGGFNRVVVVGERQYI